MVYKKVKKINIKNRIIALAVIFLMGMAVVQLKTWILERFILGYNINDNQGDRKEVLTYDGLQRSYLIHLPPQYVDTRLTSLVLVLHGVGGNAEITREMTGMNDVADKNNFIVVYPNGTGILDNYLLSWNVGECCNYFKYPNVDDAGFVQTIIGQLIGKYNIDKKKIYISGLSNGGMMSYLLACEFSDMIAAIAPVSGAMPRVECRPTNYVSLISFHGSEDKVIPYKGGLGSNWLSSFFSLNFSSTPDAVSFWAKQDGCGLRPQVVQTGEVLEESYVGCKENTEVISYTILKSGHVWPGGKSGWLLSDKPTKDIFASEIIWNFFEKHPKQN